MRVRIGHGPSGKAVSEKRDIEVPDVFADTTLSDWNDIAHELGFRAIVALPLVTADRVLGAVTFYFESAGNFTSETRSLLRIVADQMAGTAEKAGLILELKRTNSALVQTNATLEQQNQALLEARRVREEFLANMSHELRTPLTAVIGYVSLMEEELAGPLTADQQSTLAHVKDASSRLLEMIQNILELTSLRKGEVEIVSETLELGKLMEDAARAAKAPPDGVRLVIQPPPADAPTIQGDRKKIVKILAALLANSFKFSAGGVTLSVTPRGDRVFFIVRDSGIGIAPANQELIFEEFRQIDGSVTRQYGGAGLGLALARQLARLLGGDVHVHSTLGEGAAFALEIPTKGTPNT
jgi:signal transduction histidine kinase